MVGITYQNIEKQKLMTLLGNEVSGMKFILFRKNWIKVVFVAEAAFAELCNKNNWKVKEDGSIQVSNIEDSVKSRNIGEKINLESKTKQYLDKFFYLKKFSIVFQTSGTSCELLLK